MTTDSATELALKHFRWIGGHADVWAIFRDAAALSAVVTGLALCASNGKPSVPRTASC